ncbi:hypothetical protein TYRP_008237 [Tyrophagus putrescentiae]|nr:hypothetical protein TYRP_008237 [Tyrophagus putrescentiae]
MTPNCRFRWPLIALIAFSTKEPSTFDDRLVALRSMSASPLRFLLPQLAKLPEITCLNWPIPRQQQ